ncbi:[FeFe] hydrogenase H-cluster radical SAM maturase HydE [Hathewaya histolytica]|uniref:Radical SAM domain-containing protein n=1 Tax=Hathewaya histolytica TaxID=1498 RepID=A0A4U9RVA0_HATHI|nr:[FeFe] hydrogenase H-cluster radical SAM maturase HydE [Hathewaya histolytica]VTQ96464.1 radical SAM domain-containing protein [Hathewaya histolytica]
MKKNYAIVFELIEKLYRSNYLKQEEIIYLLDNMNDENKELLKRRAHETRVKFYGHKVFMRGLLEFTNYCTGTCSYCGISSLNTKIERYRLKLDEILECIQLGYNLGYRTFVLQGGEDPYYTRSRVEEIITAIKIKYPEVAITLSIGERSYEDYSAFYKCGADRYLLRHEMASRRLYNKLHSNMSFDNRRKCLYDLKKIGYQVGAGFMVGLPGQTSEDLAEDFIFLKELEPHMVGIGPFIPHKDTKLGREKGGTVKDTVTMLALTRLFLPEVLLPATTALGTLDPLGREKGLKAGANVVMPNLSPISVRKKYSLYDGKVCTGDEAAECRRCIEHRINSAGFNVDMSRGDNINWRRI